MNTDKDTDPAAFGPCDGASLIGEPAMDFQTGFPSVYIRVIRGSSSAFLVYVAL